MWFKKKKKFVITRELNPHALQALYECCLTAQGVYEYLKAVGDDKLLPGYRSCVADLNAAIEAAQQSVHADEGSRTVK